MFYVYYRLFSPEEFCFFFNGNLPWMQLGERLVQLVPTSGVDVVELEDEGTCVRFSPLLTAAGKHKQYFGLVKLQIYISFSH